MTDRSDRYFQPDISVIGDEHVRRYRASDGEDGYLWNGVPTLILTTTGRKSGEPRDVALIYAADGDRCVVIASKGGAPSDPLWFRNLEADPHVQVQVKGDRYDALARVAEGEERERLWDLMADQWPNYDLYQERTDRVIPVVVLERAAS